MNVNRNVSGSTAPAPVEATPSKGRFHEITTTSSGGTDHKWTSTPSGVTEHNMTSTPSGGKDHKWTSTSSGLTEHNMTSTPSGGKDHKWTSTSSGLTEHNMTSTPSGGKDHKWTSTSSGLTEHNMTSTPSGGKDRKEMSTQTGGTIDGGMSPRKGILLPSILAVVVALLVLVFILIIVVVWRRRQRKPQRGVSHLNPAFENNLYLGDPRGSAQIQRIEIPEAYTPSGGYLPQLRPVTNYSDSMMVRESSGYLDPYNDGGVASNGTGPDRSTGYHEDGSHYYEALVSLRSNKYQVNTEHDNTAARKYVEDVYEELGEVRK